MIVYLVWYETGYDGRDDLIGVYSTLEKANERKAGYTFYDQMSIRIEEVEVE